MTDDRKLVDCPVMISTDMSVGVYANAFRIIHDSGHDWFLDFLTFSESENTAKVVSRVRIAESFMDSVKRRLDATMVYIREERSKDTIQFDESGLPN
jgi:hypothetical protein